MLLTIHIYIICLFNFVTIHLRKDRSKCYQALISLILIGLCASMTALGVFALLKNTKLQDFTEWFIASYMILFSVLLFTYELMWWCTIGPLNKRIRKNFGFMYKITGKAMYMILVACLCIGVSSEMLGELDWLRWFTGIGWAAAGILLMFLQITTPTVFANYQAPSRGIIDPSAANDVTV